MLATEFFRIPSRENFRLVLWIYRLEWSSGSSAIVLSGAVKIEHPLPRVVIWKRYAVYLVVLQYVCEVLFFL